MSLFLFLTVARGFRAFLLLAIVCLAVQAQSGRRPREASLPEGQAPQESKAAAVPKQPAQYKLLVTRYTPGAPYVAEVVMERLQKCPTFEVKDGGDMKRKEAMNRAKSEPGIYVLWLELDKDVFHTTAPHVNYQVYEPVTGKIMTYGSIFLRPGQENVPLGGVGGSARLPPPCYATIPALDYSLFDASIETADRLISAFKLPIPPDCPQ